MQIEELSSAWTRLMVAPRTVGAAATVLLHALILSALLGVTASVPKPPQPPAWQERRADKLRDAGAQIVRVDIRSELSTRGLVCAGSSYVGIGITADPRTDRIILVGENTPAARAGLQHDDIVLNPSVWREAHQEGALLRVLSLRDGARMTASVRVGKICID